MKSKIFTLVFVIIIASVILSGCTVRQERIILFDNSTVNIERTEDIITVTEKKTDAQCRLTVKKHLVRKGSLHNGNEAKPLFDSETVKIDTVYNMLVVTDKTDNKIYYVKSR